MDGFDIFGNGDEPAGIVEVLQMIQHHVETHKMTYLDACNIVIDMIKPGHSDTSHDIRPMWTGAMFALGYGEVAHQFTALYLNEMPWGIGFAVSTEPDFEFTALSPDAQRTVMLALAACLRAGGIIVTIHDNNTLDIERPDGEASTMSMDDVVGQFRKEMEKELGPDRPDDPWKKWMT
jgi:hypothetical protein